MPIGPFASSVGVGRAEPEWAALNKVPANLPLSGCARVVLRVCGDSFGMSPRALQVCRGFAEVSIDSTEINNERKRAAFAWRWNELICPEAAME